MTKADCLALWDGFGDTMRAERWQPVFDAIAALPEDGDYIVVIAEEP